MDDQISKWLEGEISDEELRNKIGSEETAKYLQIVDEVDSWVPDKSTQLFDPKQVSDQPKEGKVRSMRPLTPYSIAASLVIAIASYFLFFNSSIVSHQTGIAEVKEITLPDGTSKIFLAPNSEISWDNEDWSSAQLAVKARLKQKKTRKVELKGKALFEVEKGSPFIVENLIGSVEVLGTTFEVDEFDNGMNVICFEGKVKASTEKGEVFVNGGDSYLYFDGKKKKKITIKETLPSWLQNETKFENAPLAQVIGSMEKLYKVTFDSGSSNIKKRFTGTIPNDKIDIALKIVFDPFDIDYVRKSDVIYLTD